MTKQTGEANRQTRDVPARRDEKRMRTMGVFILAAEQLMQAEGIENLSIRKIADAAGYSSAALYSYFEDLDELVLYASLRYRSAYIEEAVREITPPLTALERYRRLYEIFNRHSFAAPALYLNLYFGRHSGKLRAAMDTCRQLFPGEFAASGSPMRDLLEQESLPERDRAAARCLAAEGHIRPENADILAELMVRTQETFLYEMTVCPQRDVQEQNRAFLALFDRIVGAL